MSVASLRRSLLRASAPKWTKAGSFYLPTFCVARGRVDGRTFARDEE